MPAQAPVSPTAQTSDMHAAEPANPNEAHVDISSDDGDHTVELR